MENDPITGSHIPRPNGLKVVQVHAITLGKFGVPANTAVAIKAATATAAAAAAAAADGAQASRAMSASASETATESMIEAPTPAFFGQPQNPQYGISLPFDKKNDMITVYGPRRGCNDNNQGEDTTKVTAVKDLSLSGRLLITFRNLDLKGKGKQSGDEAIQVEDRMDIEKD